MTTMTMFVTPPGGETEAFQFTSDDHEARSAMYREFAEEFGHYPALQDKTCYTCDGTGLAARGWCGLIPADGKTCPDCKGLGVDQTPMGTGMDSCPYNGTDWREPCGHSGRVA